MARIISQQELDRIVRHVAQYPAGVSIEALRQAILPRMPRRTLQRRLAELLDQKRIVTQGQGRGLKYLSSTVTPQVLAPPKAALLTEPEYIPVSQEGEAIRGYIRQSRYQRKPVGYNSDFVAEYQPNETYYLPAPLREHLLFLGKTPAENRPAGTFAREIINRLLIDLSWASSRLEGNTYSQLDTQCLIEFGQQASGKDFEETQMILNHKAAIEFLISNADSIAFNPTTIKSLHALLADHLLANPRACGQLRQIPVGIGSSVYIPLSSPYGIEAVFNIIVEKAATIQDPLEQSFFAMVHLPYLQPFEDVNKRVSRLAANISLIKNNLSPLSFLDVPQQAYVDGTLGVYELNRIELLRDVFAWAYERSCQQYVAVQQRIIPPDPFRMRHYAALGEVIRTIVQGGRQADERTIRSLIPPSVPAGHHDRFVALVLHEFTGLHADNAVRFGLRPLEFASWKKG